MAASPADSAPLADWLSWIERVLVRPPPRNGVPPPEGMELGLERVGAVARRLGVTAPAPCSIIVAGTNGKGSTVTALEALLLARGLRVGATLSPHLFRFNERIRLNGDEAADRDIVGALAEIEAARRGGAGADEILLSYFEFAMLAALLCFRHATVDVAVIEVGLGGRLDAANIVDADAAVVTAIGLDHQEYLGPDREAIGSEKVAVARTGRPLIIGEREPPASVLTGGAALGARIIRRDIDYQFSNGSDGFRFAMGGCTLVSRVAPRLIEDNVAAALATLCALGLQPTNSQLEAASGCASVPARLQRFRAPSGASVIVDVAHNPHAATFIAHRLGRHKGGLTHCVIGTLADKDVAGVVTALGGIVDRWHAAPTEGPRGRPASALAALLPDNARVHQSVDAAIEVALAAAATADRVLICGSFQTASAALRRLAG